MGRKLLVADDSVTIQKVIKLALSSEGYDILAVSDGKEAIRAIQEENPDVVLIDVTLPGADAYAVKRAINAIPKLASVGFILMLSAFERVDEKAIEEVQFQGRLIKPFDPSHLRKAVSELLNRAPQIVASPPTFIGQDDLPPVHDMHPTLKESPPVEVITEEEFQVDSPAEATRTMLSLSSIESPPPPPPVVEEDRTDPNFTLPEEAVVTRTLENDIKDLTESTIKMSGLDEWNLDDSKNLKSAPPPPAGSASNATPKNINQEESTREMSPPSMDKKAALMKGFMSPPSRPLDDGGSTFPLSTAQPGQQSAKPKAATLAPPAPPPGSDLVSGRDYVAPIIDFGSESKPVAVPPSSPITRAEIEQLIRKDLEAVIEKLAREAVPRIAEAMIRKEIEKILAES